MAITSLSTSLSLARQTETRSVDEEMEFDGSRRNTESIMGRSVVIFLSSEILPVAESTGFNANLIEKVLHLLHLLSMLISHPFLKGKLALKGGSALNLFLFNTNN